MAVIEQITSGIYVVTVGTTPLVIKESHYRGDSFSLVLIGKNVDGDPFNFGLCDTIITQFRAGHPRSQLLAAEFSLANSRIILGQTDDETAEAAGLNKSALQHDIDEANTAGTTKDEIHIVDPTGLVLRPEVSRLFFDVQMTLDPDPFTLARGWVDFTYDTTRS